MPPRTCPHTKMGVPEPDRWEGSLGPPWARLLHKVAHFTSSNLDHVLVRVVCIIPISQMEKLRGSDPPIRRYLSQDPNQGL